MIAGVPVDAKDVFATWIDPLGLAISPDGDWVGMLYQRAGRYRLGFFAVEGGQRPREIELTCGSPGGLTWSPTGDAVAFYAASQRSLGANIFVLDLTSADTLSLMAEPGWHAFIPDWSADGRMLAFSAYPVPRSPEGFPRVFLASLPERQVKQITPGEHIEVRPFISPDGATLAFRRGWDIWLHNLTDGTERLLISEDDHCHVLSFGCFSPDGAQIVVEGRGTVVLIVDVATGARRALTDGSSADLRPSWLPSGRAISFVRNREKLVVTGLDGVVRWEAAPNNGRIGGSFICPRWAREVELVTFLDGDGNAWIAGPEDPPIQLTHFPERPRAKQEPKQVEYPSTGDVKVPALLLEPKDLVPGETSAVVWLHGGPHGSAAGLLTSCYVKALLDAGFLVLLPDYRGSAGHGIEWSCVSSEQRGVIDVDDVLAAKGFLTDSGFAAPGRVAVAGDSYGGYLTLMALARGSQEWACAASLCGLWDPVNLRTAWVPDNEELPDLTQRTPLNLLHEMHAPLLVIHGAFDNMSTVDEVNRASEVLLSNGTPCEVNIFEDTHGLPLCMDEAAKVLVDFVSRHTDP